MQRQLQFKIQLHQLAVVFLLCLHSTTFISCFYTGREARGGSSESISNNVDNAHHHYHVNFVADAFSFPESQNGYVRLSWMNACNARRTSNQNIDRRKPYLNEISRKRNNCPCGRCTNSQHGISSSSSSSSTASLLRLNISKQHQQPPEEPTESEEPATEKWTHANIEWQLRPAEDTPLFEKLKLRAAAKAVHAECVLNDQPIPPVLCPKGGRAVLLAYEKDVITKKKKAGAQQIAKFGITTTRGPPAQPIDETITEIYGIDLPFNGAGVAAIIYMYIEPEYRKRGIGELALEAIAAIQTVQGCDFTVLVADDDGSGRLVQWYERNGFTLAPRLQEIFGSPGGKFGVTMIRPTQVASDIFARCQIKWW